MGTFFKNRTMNIVKRNKGDLKMKGKKFLQKACTTILTASMVVGMSVGVVNVFADENTGTYSAPTQPMEIDENIVTASAHRAASPILGILGVNAITGYGMINGSAPEDYASAIQCPALGVWGSALNDNPDPYYWNYFYNFYAEANGLEKTQDALNNPAAGGGTGPQGADVATDKFYDPEHPNLSVTISYRPDVLVGTASKDADSTDNTGYDEQIAYIQNELKEDYDPELVPYVPATLQSMIETMHNLADAIERVEEKTGKTTRYGDVQAIADAYEQYVNGIRNYINANVKELKTIAIVSAVNEDGTFKAVPSTSRHYNGASQDRFVEYTEGVTYNIADKYDDGVVSDDLKSVTLTKEDLQSVDAILIGTLDRNVTVADINKAIVNAIGDETLIIQTYPNSLYGITMNSVENALGMAYYNAYLYCDELDINPVEVCAYFYKTFLHVTNAESLQTVVTTNFKGVALPDGVTNTLASDWEARMNTIVSTPGDDQPVEPTTPTEPSLPTDPSNTSQPNDVTDPNGTADSVNTNGENTHVVKTGDTAHICLYAGMLAFVTIAGVYTYKRKHD